MSDQENTTITNSTSTEDQPHTSSVWSIHKTAEGKTYYYNKETKKSSWVLPTEQTATKSQPISDPLLPPGWLAFKTPEGKIYYYNSETKKTTWNHPAAKSTITLLRPSEIAEMLPEDQFFYLLRKAGITSEHTWESALRLIINDPIYSTSLKTVSEKKEAFAKYLILQKEKERMAAEKAEQDKRHAFKSLLESTPNLYLGPKWRLISPLFSNDPTYLAIPSDKERETLYYETLEKLKTEQKINEETLIKKIKEKMITMLRSLSWQFHSFSWDEILPRLEQLPDWRDPSFDLDEVPKLELLTAYEDLVFEHQDKLYFDAKKAFEQARVNSVRRRINFSLHLEMLIHKGILTASSQWIENVLPLIKEAPVFTDLLEKNTSGSCPLDLFYDAIDRLECENASFTDAVMRYLMEYPHEILENPKSLTDVYNEAVAIGQRSEVLSGLSPLSPRNRAIKSFVQSVFHHLQNLFYSGRDFQELSFLNQLDFSLFPFNLSFKTIPKPLLEKNYRTNLRRLVYFLCADFLLKEKREEKKRDHAAKRILYDEFKVYLKANRAFVLAHHSWDHFKEKVWPQLEGEFGALGEHLARRAFDRFKEKSLSAEPNNKQPRPEDFPSRPRTFKTFSRASQNQIHTTPVVPQPSRTISSYSDIF